ncbi:MAG TPA: hypothetical protein VK181_02470 [Rhizobium sp.]|nr:hypothetical protein [Rhizobium sp.]
MPFTAHYAGNCQECGGRFDAGDLIEREQAYGYRHASCPDDPSVDLKPSDVVCESCFIVKPCGCDD